MNGRVTKMDLLQKLLPRTKTFEGTVIEVQLVGGFFSDGGRQYNHYSKQDFKDIKGYDSNGTPIIEEYTVTRYRATVQNAQGEIKTFERFGRVPEVDSQQSYEWRRD